MLAAMTHARWRVVSVVLVLLTGIHVLSSLLSRGGAGAGTEASPASVHAAGGHPKAAFFGLVRNEDLGDLLVTMHDLEERFNEAPRKRYPYVRRAMIALLTAGVREQRPLHGSLQAPRPRRHEERRALRPRAGEPLGYTLDNRLGTCERNLEGVAGCACYLRRQPVVPADVSVCTEACGTADGSYYAGFVCMRMRHANRPVHAAPSHEGVRLLLARRVRSEPRRLLTSGRARDTYAICTPPIPSARYKSTSRSTAGSSRSGSSACGAEAAADGQGANDPTPMVDRARLHEEVPELAEERQHGRLHL